MVDILHLCLEQPLILLDINARIWRLADERNRSCHSNEYLHAALVVGATLPTVLWFRLQRDYEKQIQLCGKTFAHPLIHRLSHFVRWLGLLELRLAIKDS